MPRKEYYWKISSVKRRRWYIQSNAWRKRKREEVMLKLGNCCQVCGKMDRNRLQIHHKRKVLSNIKDRRSTWNNINNLVLLCAHCHRLVDLGSLTLAG